MPTFAYTARDQAGSPVNGTITATNQAEVNRMLRGEGKYPTSIEPVEDTSGGIVRPTRRGLRMGRKDLIQFSMQLAIMVETGVTLSEALDCIAAQSDKPNVKRIVEDIGREVQSGSDFSTALQRHPRAFPRLFVSLMSASEKSGMMGRLLHRATAYLRDEYETLRRVRGALTYPAIMLVFAISTTTFLLAFVLPRFTAIYAAKKAALPMPTQVLMAVSNFIVLDWPWLIAGVVALAVGMFFLLRTHFGLRALHYIQLHVPLFGPLFRKIHLSRGLRMVGTMAGSGVNLLDCVKTAHALCDNSYFRDLWNEVSEQIQAGRQVSEPLFHSRLVPRSISQMLSSAEKSGKLAQVMEQVAEYSEQELKEKIADLTRYIEPIMIVIMGGIIGSVAMALMLPIFTISRVLAR